jgi:hypothetical protein
MLVTSGGRSRAEPDVAQPQSILVHVRGNDGVFRDGGAGFGSVLGRGATANGFAGGTGGTRGRG